MKQELRKFGFSLGLGLNILGCIMFYRGKGHFIWFTSIGSFGLVTAIICPSLLRLIKKVLDFIILWFGRVVNAVSLVIAFYLIFAPIGILFRLFRKDLLRQGVDRSAGSYWIKKKDDVFLKQSYERMG
ncbi:MAG: hypothetical protein KKD90_00770 [Candidatus Omnitrophica bacterium]|nr:hypothetical protein [Candidatus Omnitrophota bacterium]MBU4148823.1 hypothetical protein [Candidatus Omnitrophota bacterium]